MKSKTAKRIMSETSEETKQKAIDYGNNLIDKKKETYKNKITLDGCNYLVTYLADDDFENIEIIKIECNGNDFTNIISEQDKERILEILS